MTKSNPLILVVDDSTLERRLLQDALQGFGYDVITFTNGSEVVRWFENEDHPSPDIILMDAVMPVLDGFAATTAVKALQSGKTVSILMITACNDIAAIDRAFDAGAEDYIVKPVNLVLLKRRIEMIIKARQADALIRSMAYHDPLTGLPNRRMFEEELSRWLAHADNGNETLAIVFLDLDKFKKVNDCLGHAAGDLLLAEMARRFRSAVRPTDFVARLGGDEFMMILPQIRDHKSLAPVLTHLFKACDAPVSFEGNAACVGVSMGVSFFPQDGNELAELMRKADMALYRSKEKNGNTFTCYSGCN